MLVSPFLPVVNSRGGREAGGDGAAAGVGSAAGVGGEEVGAGVDEGAGTRGCVNGHLSEGCWPGLTSCLKDAGRLSVD